MLHLHLLAAYEPGAIDAKADSTVEWQIDGVDADYAHSVPAEPSGNSICPFAARQSVRVRTRVRNGNGSSTSAVRTLPMA
jgi:hypothetical protein